MDIGQRGVASHEGHDGSRMCNRIDKYGEWEVSIAENICFDDCEAREILFGMLIDDGNQSRGHRHNLFNSDFSKVGVACGPHKNYRHCTVINFAVKYLDKIKKEEPKENKEEIEVVFRRRTTIQQ